MRFHERRRAYLDIYLATIKQKNRVRKSLMVPAVKLMDDILCRTDMLVGATRYVLGQKR